MPNDSQFKPMSWRPEGTPTWRDRLLWICPIVGLIAAAVMLWLFGLTVWVAVALVLLSACPLVVVWVLGATRRQGPSARRKP